MTARASSRFFAMSVAGQGAQYLWGEAPDARRRRQHRAADIAPALVEDIDERLAVEAQRHRPAQFRVVEGRHRRVDVEIAAGVEWRDFADRLRRLRLHFAHQRDCDIIRPSQVELAAGKGQYRRRAVRDDRVLDGIEMGPPRFPVIRVVRDLDALVWLVLDEFERARSDRVLPHLRRCHMAGVDRRIARGEQREQRRLRALEVKGGGAFVIGGDARDILPPEFAWVGAQRCRSPTEQQFPSALHIMRGEWLAVMPAHPVAQPEGQRGAVFAP
jgi:hypothetical protein